MALLEEKIDGIVSLLTASQQTQQLSNTEITRPPVEEQIASSHTAPVMHGSTNDDQSSPYVQPSSHSPAELFPGLSVTIAEADRHIQTYRERIMPHFPFVPLSPKTSAFEMLTHRRLLFWTIMAMTAPQGPAVQHSFKAWFREWIADHMVKRKEKRLEILQAILIHVAWYAHEPDLAFCDSRC